MPIYEYRCLECNARFEFLILKRQDVPICVKCGSKSLERLISSCAIQGSSLSKSSCSSCNLPSCSSCSMKPSKSDS